MNRAFSCGPSLLRLRVLELLFFFLQFLLLHRFHFLLDVRNISREIIVRLLRVVLPQSFLPLGGHILDLQQRFVRVHFAVDELLLRRVAQVVATVSVQRLTLIPGDNISVEITASNSQDAQLIVNSLEEITWSLNKLVSGPSQ